MDNNKTMTIDVENLRYVGKHEQSDELEIIRQLLYDDDSDILEVEKLIEEYNEKYHTKN